MIPATSEKVSGLEPEAEAIPRHKGKATKKTTKPAGMSDFKFLR